MNDLARLADAVAADPLSTTLRLVYADAIEEAGDSEAAEFQRQLAQVVAAWLVVADSLGKAVGGLVQMLTQTMTPLAESYRPLVEAMAERLQGIAAQSSVEETTTVGD